MKKITFKSLLCLAFTLFSLVLTAQTAPDEDTDPDISCSPEFTNPDRTGPDLPSPVNVGAIDDRTCYADYSESNVYGNTWGVYNITYNSNHLDTSLQPRMERSLSRSQETGVGSYARFTGTFRILEVGDTSGTNSDGTYIAQAKGKHTGGGGSADPAICLYLAKPVYLGGVQVAFDIYAERILYRGGEGLNVGREVVYLTSVDKDQQINFELEVGFAEDPNDSTNKIHYCNAKIGGVDFNWNIPEPERGIESGIRYGAYRVKGGRAQIRWANTTYEKVEIIDNSGPDPSDDIYRLRNVATGKFLTDAGASATPVTMSDSGEAQNTHWTFVESGTYYNIDSETLGILRATGEGFSGGAYIVVSTTKAAPAADTDKTWIIHYDETTEIYRFESRTSGRFLYEDVNGSVYHLIADETDQRSQWEAIPTSQSLSIDDNELSSASIRVYPNPADDAFTIALNNISRADVIIYNILGKVVYEDSVTNGKIEIANNRHLTSGLYLVKVIADDNKVYQTKLVIR